MKLLRHTSYNLLGLGLPLLAAIFTIPLLIAELGAARFGLLTLIWAVVSYFGLFDLGLGRALTQQLAVVLGQGETERVGPLVGTSTVLMSALGLFAGLLMAASAAWGVGLINAVPDRQEAICAVYAMALAMPSIILTSGFRGVLEANHAFGVVNLIRLPMGLFTFVGPLVVVLYWEPRLDLIAAVLCVGRLLACAVHGYFAWRALPENHGQLRWELPLVKPLCISGGWLTVSNIISPLMGYVDRFVIGSVASASAVAYYVTPQELVTKLWIIPGALTAVLFPAIARQISNPGSHTKELSIKATKTLSTILLPACLTFAIFSYEILNHWVGNEIATQSFVLMQIFAMGVYLNGIATIPFTILQSADRAKTTAIIHTLEFPFYLIALWKLALEFGILGAAGAWMLRIIADCILMFLHGFRIIKYSWTPRQLLAPLLPIIAFTGILIPSQTIRIIWLLGVSTISAATLFSVLRQQLETPLHRS